MLRRFMIASAAAAVVAGGLAWNPAKADAIADFYKGKQLTILVAFGAGGGYDLYARTLAQHLGKHIPGNPKIITQYMSGAGGAKAANYFTNVAPKDGTVIGMMANGAALGQVLRANVKYDAAKFQYIGRLASMESALIVWHQAKAISFDQWKSSEVIFGATGKANQDYYVPVLAQKLLGVKVKMVLGYKGSRSINKAMEQREVDAMSNSWSSVKARLGAWVKDKKISVLAYNGLAVPAGAIKAPLMVDLATSDDDKRIMRLIASAPAVGRAYALPPGTPAARVEAMRAAFKKTFDDPAFQADAKKRKMDLSYMSGAELQKIVEQTIGASPKLIARMKGMM